MSVTLLEESVAERSGGGNGGLAARRAVTRWAWRMFFREWRQQLLVLALIAVAVAATIVGSAVATNTPSPPDAGFGTAEDAAIVPNPGPALSGRIAGLEHRFGRVDVIENETVSVPGSVLTFELRAQDPHGAFGGPMLARVSGRFPVSAGEVALTSGVASELGLRVGDVWHQGSAARKVVGIVENPQSLLDQFALVVPGQVTAPSSATILFNAPGVPPRAIGADVVTPQTVAQANPLNPETISLAVLTIGMILIALVAIGGFTVLAQRRLRSLGMLASLGATRRHVALVVLVNGVVVGVVGALLGTAVGVAAWLAYRPHLEQSAHHVVGTFALPWLVVGLAVGLAVVATAFAASRPARAVARVPVVTALSGRPAPPKKVHRSAVPGLVFLAAAFLLLGYSGGTAQGNGSRGMSELVLGLVALVPGVILLAPFFLSVVARLARHTPVAARLALRDLARYRARTGSGLAAISLGVMIAVIIATVAQVRYGNVLDYAGPNLSPNQLIVYSSAYQAPPDAPALTADQLQSQSQTARAIGGAVGAHHVLELDAVIVDIHTAPRRSASNPGAGRQWSGPIYLATPQLLRAFGITGSQADPRADVLSSRPGLSGVAALSLSWCNATSQPKQISPNLFQAQCLSGGSLAHPVIDEVGALPTGTSAPNSVMTEHAVHTLGISTSVTGWLVETARPLTAAQIADARQAASTKGMTVEAKNDAPTSAQVIDWATAFGMALALCILAMSVGLLRSETAGDLRTLAATGASGTSRRTVTAATAGAMGLLGAVLGTLCGYVGVIGYLRGNSLNGGIGALGNVPVANLLLILLGMPALAAVVGWLLAGREPSAMAHQPIE